MKLHNYNFGLMNVIKLTECLFSFNNKCVRIILKIFQKEESVDIFIFFLLND